MELYETPMGAMILENKIEKKNRKKKKKHSSKGP